MQFSRFSTSKCRIYTAFVLADLSGPTPMQNFHHASGGQSTSIDAYQLMLFVVGDIYHSIHHCFINRAFAQFESSHRWFSGKISRCHLFQINSASPGFDSRPMQAHFFFLFGGVVVVEFGCRRGKMKFTDFAPITPLQPSQFQQHDDRLLLSPVIQWLMQVCFFLRMKVSPQWTGLSAEEGGYAQPPPAQSFGADVSSEELQSVRPDLISRN
jgi:hypothetical protein